MGKSVFKAGVEVDISGKTYLLLRKLDADLWQLEEERNKRIHEYTGTQLRDLYGKGELVFNGGKTSGIKARNPGKPFDDISDKQWSDAKICRSYVLAILGHKCTRRQLKLQIEETWKSLESQEKPPPGVTSVLRWRLKYVQSGSDLVSLVKRCAKRGNRLKRYPAEVLELVNSAIDSVYLTEERQTLQDVVDAAWASVDEENKQRPKSLRLKRPTRRLIERMIFEIPAYDRCVARYGREAANKQFRAVVGHRVTEAPLRRAEMDHTLLDLMVIDDESGLPLGRPYVTVCIDDYSRCVLGIYIGFEPPSYLTVAHCLKHAFLPKNYLRERYPSIIGEWIAHGIMAILVVDNGPEFHSVSLENACYSLGIELQYSPRKNPWFKGKIERFQGTLNREVAHGIPGTTFSNILEKEDYDPLKHAVVRLSTLREVVHIWVVDVYHERVHRTLKAPPIAMWKSSISADDIHLPDDPAVFDAIMGRSEERRLTHKGIEFEGLFYNSPELTTLRRQLGDVLDVSIRIDDTNIGRIFVLSPDKKRIFTVPAVNVAYAQGLSAWQHKVCKRYAANQMKRYDTEGWIAAKQTIAHLIAEELRFGKRKTRARVARYKGDNGTLSAIPEDTSTAPTPKPVPQPEPTPPRAPTTPLLPDDVSTPVSFPMPTKHFQPVIRNRAAGQTGESDHA
nr:DDE-type integrase/transposase/recombinase [uncultured Rhodoferax sp.]